MATRDFAGYLARRTEERDADATELFETLAEHFEKISTSSVGAALVAIRTDVGLTQVELAARSGVDQGDISRIERGLANPTVGTLDRIGEAIGYKVGWVPVASADSAAAPSR
jgi:ribosome-binding protein aMBF1 (putative translation factor)